MDMLKRVSFSGEKVEKSQPPPSASMAFFPQMPPRRRFFASQEQDVKSQSAFLVKQTGGGRSDTRADLFGPAADTQHTPCFGRARPPDVNF